MLNIEKNQEKTPNIRDGQIWLIGGLCLKVL